MSIINDIKQAVQQSMVSLFKVNLEIDQIMINETKPEFEGDFTLVTFSLTKLLSKKPEDIAEIIGQDLISHQSQLFTQFNIVKGFLNLTVHPDYYLQFLDKTYNDADFGKFSANQKKVMIEYSSPNTNKPLHFGHLRNNFLGFAMANIFKATGHDVIKANLINDRGIHICKSMIAWTEFGDGVTPESSQQKGDHLVGDYYVKFNDVYKKEVAELIEGGMSKEEAEKKAPIMLKAQDLLRKWEAGDKETIELWTMMNQWVYDGFKISYKNFGLDFDKMYYESQTYLLGKSLVEKGLQDGVLFRKDDNSVWIDLTEEGLDQKLLLRGDGTSVYITQDIGTADLKYKDYALDTSIYVIGDEQNYHMQVLQLILQKMKLPSAKGLHHLSYGMVELPSGKMKSREGTVVDADDMLEEMIDLAKKNTEELGKVEGFTEEELTQLYNTLGLGALKFYLLRVDPKKKMIFNPQESIDFHGFTGPFVQYTHARICSILRKAGEMKDVNQEKPIAFSSIEKQLLKTLERYPDTLQQATSELNPSLVCNYIFHLAKEFNSFLTDHSVLKAADASTMNFRLQICTLTKHVIQDGLNLLGINAPERM